MNSYITFLRGINVSGQKLINMNELKNLFETNGFIKVKTYIQSGNVIFGSPEKDRNELKKRIQALLNNTYGSVIPVFLFSSEDLLAFAHRNPFLTQKNSDTRHLYITLLEEEPDQGLTGNIQMPEISPDSFRIMGKIIYLYCPHGYGRTKFTTTYFEKKLNTFATTRNWKTLIKLVELSTTG